MLGMPFADVGTERVVSNDPISLYSFLDSVGPGRDGRRL
jgi:hypothetical protein